MRRRGREVWERKGKKERNNLFIASEIHVQCYYLDKRCTCFLVDRLASPHLSNKRVTSSGVISMDTASLSPSSSDDTRERRYDME
jgi:hypothetical protein